jgi:hypothetical protein
VALEETLIEVYERNDPSVSVTLKRKDDEGVETPYDLSAATIELYAKKSANVADADAQLTYTSDDNITIVDAEAGTFRIDFEAADLASPGNLTYHVDTIIGGKRETVLIGTLSILNV